MQSNRCWYRWKSAPRWRWFKRKINKNTKAVLFVHFSGLCKTHNIRIFKKIFFNWRLCTIFGVRIHKLYSFERFSVFILKPYENIWLFREAGGISFKNKKLTEEFKVLRYAGIINKEYCKTPEINHKIDNIHCYTKNLRILIL